MTWTHALCEACWKAREPGREPFRLVDVGIVDRKTETCCRCGEPTTTGIYVRANQQEMPYCPEVEP